MSVQILANESPALEESLVAQQQDLGLTEVEHLPPGTSGELLFSASMVCVLPNQHPLLRKPRLEPSDFHEIDFINLSSADTYQQQLDRRFSAAGVNRRTVIETSSAASLCAMVRQGLGVAIVNPLSGLEAAQNGLALRDLTIDVPYKVMLVHPNHRSESAAAQSFCHILRAKTQNISKLLAKGV